MANQAQKNAARRLHELSDGSEITATYGEGGYTIAHTDPYELAAIKLVGGVLSVAATVASVVVSGDAAPGAGTFVAGVTYTAVVTLNDGPGDETVTWSLAAISGPGTYVIDAAGVVTSADAGSGESFDVVATSNLDGTTVDSLTVTVAA